MRVVTRADAGGSDGEPPPVINVPMKETTETTSQQEPVFDPIEETPAPSLSGTQLCEVRTLLRSTRRLRGCVDRRAPTCVCCLSPRQRSPLPDGVRLCQDSE